MIKLLLLLVLCLSQLAMSGIIITTPTFGQDPQLSVNNPQEPEPEPIPAVDPLPPTEEIPTEPIAIPNEEQEEIQTGFPNDFQPEPTDESAPFTSEESTEPTEPIESTELIEPTQPTEHTEPTEPIENSEDGQSNSDNEENAPRVRRVRVHRWIRGYTRQRRQHRSQINNIPVLRPRFRRNNMISLKRSFGMMTNMRFDENNRCWAERRIYLRQAAPIRLFFSSITFGYGQIQVQNQSLELTINGHKTTVKLNKGLQTHQVTFIGTQGLNSISFRLNGNSQKICTLSTILVRIGYRVLN